MVGVGLGSLFVLGYAAAYVPPDVLWWVAPFGVLLPWIAPLVAAGAVIGLVRSVRRGSAVGGLLAVTVLVLLGGRFGASWMPMPSPDASDVDLRVMTFNAPTRGPDPDRLADAVSGLVDAAGPDVVALQEPFYRILGGTDRRSRSTSSRSRTDTVASPQVRVLFDAYRPPASVPSRVYVHLPVVGRVPLDSMSLVRLDPKAPESYGSYAARVPFTWRGKQAVLYNVHLYTVSAKKPWQEDAAAVTDLSFWRPFVESYRQGALQRARQARHLRRLIDAETRPVIVVGDFNSTVHHWVVRHVTAGLRDAHAERGRGTGATYPATRPLVRIDHVFVDPAWDVVSARVLRDHAFSDHRPVVVHLRWAGDASERGRVEGRLH